MKAYILSIAGAVLLSAVITIILPDGKMGKFVKGGLKLVILVVLVSPFVNFFTGKNLGFSAGGQISPDGKYIKTCGALMEEADEREITSRLLQHYGVEGSVVVTYAESTDLTRKKIQIKIKNFGIYQEDERIDIIEKITSELSAAYGCATEVS